MTHPITTYLNSIKDKLATDQATEHTHRPALADLFETFGEDIRAINEPTRIACGAPDLAILRGDFMVGHVEAKDVGVSLDAAESSDQLKRYRLALDNLILMDYLEFRWHVDGETLVAVWTNGEAVERDDGVNAVLTLPGFLADEVVGINIFQGFEQALIFENMDGSLVIRNLLVKDYPVFIRLSGVAP